MYEQLVMEISNKLKVEEIINDFIKSDFNLKNNNWIGQTNNLWIEYHLL